MEGNTQEKNLIEKKESFFGKVKNFFKRIFKKKDIKEEVKEEVVETVEEDNEFNEYIKITEDEETKLLDLQRRYRKGEIAENDLTDEQIEALSNLYDKQISDLKKSIAIREKKIEEYKNQEKVEKNNS